MEMKRVMKLPQNENHGNRNSMNGKELNKILLKLTEIFMKMALTVKWNLKRRHCISDANCF